MYKVSTYFYWFIIISIRIIYKVEYFILILFRWPILKLFKSMLMKKYLVKILFENEEMEHMERDSNCKNDIGTNRPITYIRFKETNLALKMIAEGKAVLLEGYVNRKIEVESFLEITERMHQDCLNTYNPLLRLQDWVYLQSQECPWDDRSLSKSNDWAYVDTKAVTLESMGNRLNCISGYWDKDVTDLNMAIDRNMKKVGDKLNLKPAMKVLDLGCGTGIFANYLATNYSVNVIGINLCKEEVDKAEKPHPKVKIICGDYRILLENTKFHQYFDRVVSIHLIEHIGGPKRYTEYFNTVNRYLKPRYGKLFIQCVVTTKLMSPRIDTFFRKNHVHRLVTPLTKELIDELTRISFTFNVDRIDEHYVKTLREYVRIIQNIPVESAGKTIMELCYTLGAKIIDLGIYEVWQIIAEKP